MNIARVFRPGLVAGLSTVLFAGMSPAGSVTPAQSPRLADVRLDGAVGRKMLTLVGERLTGAAARGPIYDEAVNAFRTHYDDHHQCGGWEDGKGLWQGEYWGKTMLSAAVVADMTGDAAFKRWLRERALAFVTEFQKPDGYLSSYADGDFVGGRSKDGSEVFCWNVWGQKYTMWALLELSRVTDSPELLAAARRMADNLLARLARLGRDIGETGYFAGLPSMSILKPMVLLHERTGETRYRDFARRLVKGWQRTDGRAPNLIANAAGERPYADWYPNPGNWAKAYETMSCLEGLVAYAALEQDARILTAVRRIVGGLERTELNAVGGVGYFDHFTHAAACPNATTEPCDVTHWIRVNRELFLATDDPHYLDNLEFAFYNAFLAGVYRDGKWGAHSVRSHGTRHRTAPHQVGMKFHQCCIDNMPRTFVDFASTMVSRTPAGTFSVNLYSPGRARLGGDDAVITGDYPVGDRARVTIRLAAAGKVRLRLPRGFDRVSVNGEACAGAWREFALPAGEHAFDLAFARSLRLVASTVPDGAAPRAREFERPDENPEMKGLARTRPAARLVYGPLLLARSMRLGASRDDVLGAGARLGLTAVKPEPTPAPKAAADANGVWGAWTVTFLGPNGPKAVKVCDFASAADADDPTNAFSIWFE